MLEGERPEYTGEMPTRPDDELYTYEFTGWLPTIVIANADRDYTAQYIATLKGEGIDEITNDPSPMINKVIKDGQIYILRGDKIYTLTGQAVR